MLPNGVQADFATKEERGKYVHDQLFAAGALLLRRETYEIFAAVWPNKTAADDKPGSEGLIDRINSMAWQSSSPQRP